MVLIYDQHLTYIFLLYGTVYIDVHKGNYFDKCCIFEVLLPFAFRESFQRITSPYSISHAHISAMFLQNKGNHTIRILRDAQTRSLSQRSVRFKKHVSKYEGTIAEGMEAS
jgi:hypothetical protein